VTPETAFPVGLIEVNPALLAKMRSFSSATGSNIFLGAPYLDILGKVRNSMFHLAPERSELARYDKTRLWAIQDGMTGRLRGKRDQFGVLLTDAPVYEAVGGDFREAEIVNGIAVRKGWYIDPKTGQKIETDF
jgi:hypothetical protein